MDISKLRIADESTNLVSKSNELKIDFQPNRIKFNLMEILPTNAILKKYNISLLDPNKGNRIVDIGLKINTDVFLDDVYSSLTLKGNLLYEYKDETYEININNRINALEENKIINNVKHLSSVILNSDEDVINYLLDKISSLETRIIALELR